jgi:hypothetical protein
VEDYDSPVYDDFWEACVDLALVPSFHILTSSSDALNRSRGPKMNNFLSNIVKTTGLYCIEQTRSFGGRKVGW